MAELVFTVNSDESVTLQSYLREKCGVSRRLLQKLKNREGGITRNGEFIRTIDEVYKDDVIVLNCGESNDIEPNGELKADIVFENENIIIFDKPSGMPVHPSVRHRSDTLANLFAYLYPQLTFRSVNRLDKDTSGLCLTAKDPYSANLLQKKCRKVYFAAAEGIITDSGIIDAPIARERESIITRCVRDDGQRAVTRYEPIMHSRGHTLLKIDLETGRTHQIRVHFAYIGHPLAGDDLYGGSREFIGRQALHCGKMILRLPNSTEETEFSAPLPDDIKNLFEE